MKINAPAKKNQILKEQIPKTQSECEEQSQCCCTVNGYIHTHVYSRGSATGLACRALKTFLLGDGFQQISNLIKPSGI